MAKIAERIKTHLHDTNDPKNKNVAADAMFELERENEHVFFEAVVELEGHNVWVRPHGRTEQAIDSEEHLARTPEVVLLVVAL